MEQRRIARLTLDRVRDAFFPVCQTIQERPAQSHGLGAETQGLHDVCPASDTAVDPYFRLVKYLGCELADFEEGVEWRRGGVEVSGAASERRADEPPLRG